MVRVKLALSNLAPTLGSGAALPSVTGEIRADFEPGGRTTFGIPIHLDYGTRSTDLAFSGTLVADAGGRVLDATLGATSLVPADLPAIALLLGREGADAGAGDAGAPLARPALPFWPGVRGRVLLKLDLVSLPRAELRDVRGTLVLEPASLSVEEGSANLGDGCSSRFAGRLEFVPGGERPYSLKGTVSLDNVDAGRLFRAANPDRSPAIDGRFDITGHVTGAGRGLQDLLDAAQGDLRLSSKDGRFRALQTDVIDAIKQAPSKLVGALDSVSSLFGKKSENIASALVESARELSDIRYDQMSISAERGPDLDIRLTEVTLIAPEERLTGRGRIAYAEGVPISDQALSVDLDMGARAHVAKVLDLLGLLKEGQDELGYRLLNQPIHLGGSLRNVDQSQWKDMLLQAPLIKKGGGLFDKLLGR
jgi:hypothetical protein